VPAYCAAPNDFHPGANPKDWKILAYVGESELPREMM
jgi:hypothetical protein